MMTVEISISAITQHKKHLQVVFFVLRILVAQYGSQPNSWSTVAILSFRATMQKTELSWTTGGRWLAEGGFIMCNSHFVWTHKNKNTTKRLVDLDGTMPQWGLLMHVRDSQKLKWLPWLHRKPRENCFNILRMVT